MSPLFSRIKAGKAEQPMQHAQLGSWKQCKYLRTGKLALSTLAGATKRSRGPRFEPSAEGRLPAGRHSEELKQARAPSRHDRCPHEQKSSRPHVKPSARRLERPVHKLFDCGWTSPIGLPGINISVFNPSMHSRRLPPRLAPSGVAAVGGSTESKWWRP